MKRNETIFDMNFEFKKQICFEFFEIFGIQMKRNLRMVLQKLAKNKIEISFLVLR